MQPYLKLITTYFPSNEECVAFLHGDPLTGLKEIGFIHWRALCGRWCVIQGWGVVERNAVLLLHRGKQPVQNALCKRLSVHLRSCDFVVMLFIRWTSGNCGGHARSLKIMTSGLVFKSALKPSSHPAVWITELLTMLWLFTEQFWYCNGHVGNIWGASNALKKDSVCSNVCSGLLVGRKPVLGDQCRFFSFTLLSCYYNWVSILSWDT